MIDDVIQLFIRYIESPEAIGEWLLGIDNVYEDEGALIFTLQGLYSLVSSADSMPYEAFRSALYASDINAMLAKRGYHIAVYENSGKVDDNWYVLKIQSTSGSPPVIES